MVILSDDFRLDDPDDTSEYLTVQYFKSSAVNPCINTSYAFVERVIQVLKDYHQEAGQPLTLIHLGGDEVPKAWIESPICQSLLNATNRENLHDMIYSVKLRSEQWSCLLL